MKIEEVYRLSTEVLGGINRVIETFETLAPQGDALLMSETRVSDDDALFFGRVSSALSVLRACANRLILLAGETGLSPKLIEVRVSRNDKLPTERDQPIKHQLTIESLKEERKHKGKRRRAVAKGLIESFIMKRLGRATIPLKKAELVRSGMEQGFSDPAIYHQISRLVAAGKIHQDGNHNLWLDREPPPPPLQEE